MPTKCIITDDKNIRCKDRARFNLQGNPAKFCINHKTLLMIDTTKAYCFSVNCNKRANYKVEEGHACAEHRGDKYTDINYKKCQLKVNGKRTCSKRAIYNYKDAKGPDWCEDHKDKNMKSF